MRAFIRILLAFWAILLLHPSAKLQAQLGDTTFVEYSTQVIDSTAYTNAVKEVTYEKTKDKLLPRKFEKKKKKKKKSQKEDRSTADFSFLNTNLIKVLMYTMAGGLLLLILWLILGNIQLKQKPKTVVTDIEDDYIEDIEAVDTEAGLKAALAAEDYRTACRMIFLRALQQLQQDNEINWKPEKTNRHYLRELASSTHIDVFRPLAITYENVWYGNKPIAYQDLRQYVQTAQSITPITLDLHE